MLIEQNDQKVSLVVNIGLLSVKTEQGADRVTIRYDALIGEFITVTYAMPGLELINPEPESMHMWICELVAVAVENWVAAVDFQVTPELLRSVVHTTNNWRSAHRTTIRRPGH
jgi:hypothetical protein